MQNLNENITSTSDTSPRRDRHLLAWHRALIPGTLLMMITVLIVDPLIGVSKYPTLVPGGDALLIVAFVPLMLFLLIWAIRSLLNDKPYKDNLLLLKALVLVTAWTTKDYQRGVSGLDEREKLNVDQAFRTSYQILASICGFVVLFIEFNIFFLHLSYRLGYGGTILILFGSLILLFFLPATIAAWKEGM